MELDGWEKTRLDEHITIKHGFAFSSEYFDPNGEDIVLTPGNFYEEGGFRPLGEKQKRYNGPIPKDYILSSGDMLVAMTEQAPGLLGSTLFVPSVGRYLHNQRLGLIQKLEGSRINLNFLHLLLGMPSIRRRISAESGGTKVKHTSPSKITGLDVLLPPLPEQKKIAEILSTWDRAIETAEALLATARTQKRALMQTLLTGKRRFPEFEGQEWREVRLGHVGVVSSAGVDKKTDPKQPEVRLLNFLDVFRREFIFDSELDHVVTAPPAKVEQCNVSRGDVFFTPSSETRDEIAIPAVAAEDMPGVCYSYHVVRYRLKEDWDLNFRAFVFQTDDFRRQAYRLGDGSGQRYVISQNNFRQMLVRVPGLAEQKKIGAVLKAASDEVERLEKGIEKLRTEKKALMQQLLTGKRRVRV
ncbi:hypothetical protein B6V74_14760 [Thioclava sp. F42-5]|uniref:restriction endonuclease subunit S n=1 Tax=Thioclava sp. F42-5 TaxID=1973005 RepID=UPI000B542DA2|nr:restriction endonuclease subunit S [Thioclava sp. F42-5]OWY08399.1 hypothetical protein B6V74_14760 [Thioclava sp. F42-5]